jgi:prolyl 4-hydroxylase
MAESDPGEVPLCCDSETQPIGEDIMIEVKKPLAWTVENFLAPKECQSLMQRIEDIGPTDAPVTTARGFVMMPELRNNKRVIIDDVLLAQKFFNQAKPHIPQKVGEMKVVGANERFRCYRYEPGQYFAPHYDGAYRRNAREWSLLTLIVYLNEDFTGGETNFLELKLSIIPKTGMALLFQHATLHEGAAVKTGVKYAARTDIMYREEL